MADSTPRRNRPAGSPPRPPDVVDPQFALPPSALPPGTPPQTPVPYGGQVPSGTPVSPAPWSPPPEDLPPGFDHYTPQAFPPQPTSWPANAAAAPEETLPPNPDWVPPAPTAPAGFTQQPPAPRVPGAARPPAANSPRTAPPTKPPPGAARPPAPPSPSAPTTPSVPSVRPTPAAPAPAGTPAAPSTPAAPLAKPASSAADRVRQLGNRPPAPDAPGHRHPSPRPAATAGSPLAKPTSLRPGPAIVTGMPTAAAKPRVPASTVHVDATLDEAGAGLPEKATQLAPPWLISMVVHIAVLIGLGLIPLAQAITPVLSIEASYVEDLGEQLLDDTITSTAIDTVSNVEPAFAKDLNPVEDPLAAVPKLDIRLDAPGATVDLEAPSIGMALTGREKGAKAALLAAYGGTAVTEGAIGMALDWLRRNQQRDGSWSLSGPYANGVTLENRTGATAMALLAFQGAGHTHQQGEHKETVAKGLRALLKMQDGDGNFFHQGSSGHRLYSQAMATIVVCELYAMTKDPEVKEAAEKALDYAARYQADDGRGGGGWRYQPGQDVDLSVTGWFVMAFQSGRMAGLDNYSQTLQRVSLFLDHVEEVKTGFNGEIEDIGYYYRPDESNMPPRMSMTAEALLCRQYLGWNRNEPRLVAGVKKLLLPANRINWEEPNFYYWYYATQVLHHMGGDEWHQWNTVMREVLPQAQERSGREKGSWSPAGDSYGYQGGRMYSTCFCVYMLESYYRHLPLYGK